MVDICANPYTTCIQRKIAVIENMDLSTIEPTNPFLEKPRTIAELATYTGKSQNYLRGEIAAGRLVARKHSYKTILIWPNDLRKWIGAASTE